MTGVQTCALPIFSGEVLQRWVKRKRAEERSVRDRPHPYEIELYYDL